LSDEEHIDEYLPFLESLLTPSRLEHSLGVMQVMAELHLEIPAA
jgi:HD superfamily phosphohydrolase YqeK